MSRHTRRPKRSKSRTPARGFEPDYSENVKDLKRIGALAAVFITLLVILSFILR